MERVDFEFTKDWGMTKKGTVKKLRRSFARSLEDLHKVGKIKPKMGRPKVEKDVKPQAKKPTGPQNTK